MLSCAMVVAALWFLSLYLVEGVRWLLERLW